MNAKDQKDFRYIQVGDDTAIGGTSTTTYRAYLNMNGVAENASGEDYYDTWYDLGVGGDMDNVYIEYHHVAPASFHAIDTRNDPVEGAEFALYTDAECHTPLIYKNAEVKATSNNQGLVSFGKIPRGTYYMKETVIPDGYKKLADIYTVVVNGKTPIANVVHSDDDGSAISSDVARMKLAKESDDSAIKSASNGVSFEVTLAVEGDYADKTRAFEFELTMPEGMSQLDGTIGDKPVFLTNENATFPLAHGQTIRFTDVPATVSYTLSQTKVAPYTTQASADVPGTVTVDTTVGNKFVMTLSQISGTSDSPAHVTITNTLASVSSTGISDNVTVWVAVVAGSVLLMALLWCSRRFVR